MSSELQRYGYEPAGLQQAYDFAEWVRDSQLFPNLKSREQVVVVLAMGREMGLGAMQSLQTIDVVKGRPSLRAVGIAALVRRSPACKFLRLVESSEKSATWETQRVEDPAPSRCTFTIEDAERRGLTGNDNWRKMPKVMLEWRALSALARLVYPEALLGLYSDNEVAEFEPSEPVAQAPVPQLTATVAAPSVEDKIAEVLVEAEGVAAQGLDALKAWWTMLSPAMQRALKPEKDRLKAIAEKVQTQEVGES